MSEMTSARCMIGITIALMLSNPASAQAWRADADDHGAVLTVGIGLAGITMLAGLDSRFAKSPPDAPPALSWFPRVGSQIGGRGPIFLAGALATAGYLGDDGRLAGLGLRTFGAIALTYAVTSPLKLLIGRPRPYAGNSRTVRLGAGIGNPGFRSFPSDHSARAFAVATVLATSVAHTSLTGRRIIGGTAYAAAASIAVSRVALSQHWASDIVAGAAIGVASGSFITHRARRAGNRGSGHETGFSMQVPLIHATY